MKAFDLPAAKWAAQAGELEAWVHRYLCGPGKNPEFSEGLRREPPHLRGPVSAPLARLRRSCGPEPEMEFRAEPSAWSEWVRQLKNASAPVEAFPPLIVRYDGGNFVVRDGNHRHAAFVARGLESCWIILWYPSERELEHHRQRGFRIDGSADV